MSSNTAPPDERKFFERLADNWYGSITDENVNGFQPGLAPTYSGFERFVPDFLPQAIRPRAATESISYYRLDTGNPTKDAIFSVLLNSLGVDNAMRATESRRSGDVSWNNYGKELVSGAAELYFVGGGLGVKTLVAGGRPLVNLFRRAKVTTPGVITGGLPTLTPTIAAPAGLPPQFARLLPTQGPTPATLGPATTARTGPRLITQPGRAVDATANIFNKFGQLGYGGSFRALGRRVLPASRGGRFGAALLALGVGSQVLGGLPGSKPAPTAAENAAVQAQKNPATAPPEDEKVVPRDIVPSGDPIVDAGNNAKLEVAGINRQYENILRELKGMYNLSETEEEKDRLRFLLADIEAQRDAGLQAIAEGYAQTVTAMRERGVTAKADADERATRFGGQLEGYADNTAERMALQNMQQQAQFRGLGSGSASPVNEWVGLMSAMAPAQQQYTQRMGDITSEGINFMADTTSAQGQAQQADLQRLAAATRSAGIMSQQRQVGDRIQRESEQLRAATLQTMMQQANAVQSVSQIGMDPLERARLLQKNSNLRPGAINGLLRSLNQPDLTPGELQLVDVYNSQYYGQDLMDAARTPAS